VPQIRYTVRARQDLISSWAGIAQTNPAAADRIYDRLEIRTGPFRIFVVGCDACASLIFFAIIDAPPSYWPFVRRNPQVPPRGVTMMQ
jgi:hypothetical protein